MDKIEKHGKICLSLNELYARKNADYGDSFGRSFREYGLTMVCIRLEDKLNRIKSLSKNAAQVSDESIVDTLMDLANYSIMALVELAPGETMKGDHLPGCNPKCLCVTCIHDTSSADRIPCCSEHGSDKCYVESCPDYVAEGS